MQTEDVELNPETADRKTYFPLFRKGRLSQKLHKFCALSHAGMDLTKIKLC